MLRAFSDRFARWGFRPEALTPVYGLSEAALAVTFSDLDRPFRAAASTATRSPATASPARRPTAGRSSRSAGRPRLPAADRRRGGPRSPRGPGRAGLGPGPVADGRLSRRPGGHARALRDGWLDTGDLGFLREGELYLTGRAKDVVILRGRNYAPEEIERAVEGVPGVRTGCVVAASWLPEDAPGEVLALFVEASRQATPAERAALPEACRAAVLGATGLAVDRVVVLAPGTLPRTSSGKLRRAETLRLYLAGELTAPDR